MPNPPKERPNESEIPLLLLLRTSHLHVAQLPFKRARGKNLPSLIESQGLSQSWMLSKSPSRTPSELNPDRKENSLNHYSESGPWRDLQVSQALVQTWRIECYNQDLGLHRSHLQHQATNPSTLSLHRPLTNQLLHRLRHSYPLLPFSTLMVKNASLWPN